MSSSPELHAGGRSLKALFSVGILLPPTMFIFSFFIVPLAYLFYGSFKTNSQSELFGSSFTFENYTTILTDPFYLLIIERTILMSCIVLGLSLLLGYPTAMVISRMGSRGRLIMLGLLTLPLMVSNVVRAYGWVIILGRTGVINGTLQDAGLIERPLSLLYGIESVMLGFLTVLLPYIVITISNTLVATEKVYGEAAQSLGAGPIRSFLYVTWPLSSPGVAAGLMLSLFLMLSAYVTIALLGGPRYKLLVSMIVDSVGAFQWPTAAALSFILLTIACLGGLLIQLLIRPQRVKGAR